tara:strand:- start:197 stop:502 length:306 start_codon:yes stop_codon:yes gene_type:complete
MKLSYRTEKDTDHGRLVEYHHIDNGTSVECTVESGATTYSFFSKSLVGKQDELCLRIGDLRVDFPITMVDELIEHVKVTMEEYDNKLHEEQLEDERSADAK